MALGAWLPLFWQQTKRRPINPAITAGGWVAFTPPPIDEPGQVLESSAVANTAFQEPAKPTWQEPDKSGFDAGQTGTATYPNNAEPWTEPTTPPFEPGNPDDWDAGTTGEWDASDNPEWKR